MDVMDEIVVTHQPRRKLFDDDTEETSLVEPILSIAEDIPVPKVFDRLSRVRLHHEWMTEKKTMSMPVGRRQKRTSHIDQPCPFHSQRDMAGMNCQFMGDHAPAISKEYHLVTVGHASPRRRIRPSVPRMVNLPFDHPSPPESYDSGSYRYLHYTAYGGDGLKVFDGQIETAYDSELKWCLRCWPSTVRVRLADTNGTDILMIKLTGRLSAHPIDTAELRLPCGHLLATVKWNMPWFEVYDMDDERALMMKWPRCIVCSLSGEYRILSGDGKTELGTMEASYSVLGPKWSGEEVLNTYVPLRLDPRLKAAWVSLMFLLKLGAGGREYAKIVSSD